MSLAGQAEGAPQAAVHILAGWKRSDLHQSDIAISGLYLLECFSQGLQIIDNSGPGNQIRANA